MNDDLHDRIDEYKLDDINKKYIKNLRGYISYHNIPQKRICKSCCISQSNLSKILNGHIVSKKLYHKVLTNLQEYFDPLIFVKTILNDFDIIDPVIDDKIKNLERLYKAIMDKNKRYLD